MRERETVQQAMGELVSAHSANDDDSKMPAKAASPQRSRASRQGDDTISVQTTHKQQNAINARTKKKITNRRASGTNRRRFRLSKSNSFPPCTQRYTAADERDV